MSNLVSYGSFALTCIVDRFKAVQSFRYQESNRYIYIYMYSVESAVHLFVLVKVSSLIEAHAANLGPKRLSVVFRGFTKQDAV